MPLDPTPPNDQTCLDAALTSTISTDSTPTDSTPTDSTPTDSTAPDSTSTDSISTDKAPPASRQYARLLTDRTYEIKETITTMLSTIPGMEIVSILPLRDDIAPALTVPPILDSPLAGYAFDSITSQVTEIINSDKPCHTFSCQAQGAQWGVVIEPILADGSTRVGVLVLARQGRLWSERERSLSHAFGEFLGLVATRAISEINQIHQARLDELVANIAEHIMPATRQDRQEVLDWTTRVLGEFLGSDVVFLRSHDRENKLSILEAEWPERPWEGPDPDPLAVVAHDVDPVFEACWDLKRPIFPDYTADETADYMDRIEPFNVTAIATGIAVPLVAQSTTCGLLGFIHFEARAWVPAELNALQAVASLLVQFQARLNAEYNANHDVLTALPNRRSLVTELDSRLESQEQFAVMIIDLDRFKVMNDFLGHASGDLLLSTIANRIRTSIRPGDFAARLGGDEFVFLMGDVSSEQEALAGARRIIEVIGQPMEIAGQSITHTASIGVALSTPEDDGLALIAFADVAMYSAKSRGRNRAVVFDDALRDQTNEHSRTELLLSQAIEQGDLRLHYQPEVDLETGKLLAFEALVRWNHPSRGTLKAKEFIAVAEETGMVTTIDRWVLSQACRQLALWRTDRPDRDLTMRVNMSPVDFRFDDMIDFVRSCLEENAIPPHCLCIEVTEHVVISEPTKTAHILKALRDLGVEVAIDDFGTGFASMTELKSLPVNFLKLDMSFIRGVATDRYDNAIVQSIILLARTLGLGVIAEGIENAEVAQELVKLGCLRGQGFIFSQPRSAADLAPVLRDWGVVHPSPISSSQHQ